jgi:CubicO group peptidase (beta-lactamase class C family)
MLWGDPEMLMGKRQLLSLHGALVLASCASRDTAPAAAPPSAPPERTVLPTPSPPSVGGIWLGTLNLGAKKLRAQVRLDVGASVHCEFDSIDQKQYGIPCSDVVVSGDSLSFEVPSVKGSWKGTIAPDGNMLTGTWSQGWPIPLVLTRQNKAIERAKVPLDPALPPVELAGLKDVLTADLAAAIASGDLAPSTNAGVTIGVIQHGQRRIWSYGATKPDSVFEIGSVTKTFTALILAQMVEQKKVRIDEPVRALLPAGTVTAPLSGEEITLLALSTQHSGLPRMPDNFHPADPSNPYADYDEKALFDWLRAHGVGMPSGAPFGYSNLGVGLLGTALAHRAGVTYEALLEREVTGPLGMRETVIAMPKAMAPRFVPGHSEDHAAARAWDFGALVGAGSVRSTAADMLVYLQAHLHPDKLPEAATRSAEGKTLPAAIAATHVARAEASEGMHIALNWFRSDKTGSYWHNGATGGYSSFVLWNPESDVGFVVLSNTNDAESGFTDRVGKHIAQRLMGVRAVSLAPLP